MVHKQYRRQTTKKCREFTRTGGELNIFTKSRTVFPCVCAGTDHHSDVFRCEQGLVLDCTVGEGGFGLPVGIFLGSFLFFFLMFFYDEWEYSVK